MATGRKSERAPCASSATCPDASNRRGSARSIPAALDRARRDIDTWRDLYYSVEAKLKQANFTLERVLSFDPVRHFLETIPPGVTLTVRHDHEPDPAPDEGQN